MISVGDALGRLEVQVKRSCLVVAGFALLSISPVFGQYVAAIEGCAPDIKKYCADAGGERFAACVKTNFPSLSEQCKTALARVATQREACNADIKAQCPTVKLGAGRLFLCVKK